MKKLTLSILTLCSFSLPHTVYSTTFTCSTPSNNSSFTTAQLTYNSPGNYTLNCNYTANSTSLNIKVHTRWGCTLKGGTSANNNTCSSSITSCTVNCVPRP